MGLEKVLVALFHERNFSPRPYMDAFYAPVLMECYKQVYHAEAVSARPRP